MGQIMKTYLGIFFLLVTGMVGIGVVTAGIQSANARNYHADVISEIECSNFNDAVISSCRQQAKEAGYELVVKTMVYNSQEHTKMAEVILHYEYAIPVLNLVTDHQVRGFAK
ncbi:MAG: hypothetical protein HFH37_10060 [Lachnospiraceae bacterium]|jgi:hypothetical protein|nr:hypothetical protein [Lachnospiraceae bacterium]